MKNKSILLISTSLFFAMLMIVAARIAPDRDTKVLWVNLLIAAWWIPYSFLIAKCCRGCKTR